MQPSNKTPMLIPQCPHCKKQLSLRPEGRQTPEQKWCGTWYDCTCGYSLLIESNELIESLLTAKDTSQ